MTRIGFRYVLDDVWYASSENMIHVKQDLGKESIMPIKTNRKVALSLERKKHGEYEQVASVELDTIYQRRWKVEEYHKSLKSNASLAKSPTKTI